MSVRNAHGKGPEHVIGYAVKLSQRFCYDACVVLLDTDIELLRIDRISNDFALDQPTVPPA